MAMKAGMLAGSLATKRRRVVMVQDDLLAMKRSALRTVLDLQRAVSVLREVEDMAQRLEQMLNTATQQSKETFKLLEAATRKPKRKSAPKPKLKPRERQAQLKALWS